jgi:hypothetical protein
MQTLNVGAGQTDAEYKETTEQRQTDLRDESRDKANYFFVAAGLAALGTGLLPIQVTLLVNIGVIDLMRVYKGQLGLFHPLAMYGAAATWVLIVVVLGFAARSGQRWAFLAGIVIYGADMIALIMMFSLWAFGVHAFFVFQWFQGQKVLEELKQGGS